LPNILAATGLTKTQFGIVYSLGFAAQSVGKISNGLLIDMSSGKRMLFLALLLCLVASAAFGLVGTFYTPDMGPDRALTAFAVLWFVNRYGQV
jgi:sugar phosphate permease